MSKTFSLSMPRITSITKSDVTSSSKPSHKRATGKVLVTPRAHSSRSASKGVSAVRGALKGNSWVSLASAAGVITLVVAFGFYVYMINAYASKGYELKKQQAVMKEIQETNKRLVIEQAASGSIVKINDVASAAKMVPVTGEEFLVANQISSR